MKSHLINIDWNYSGTPDGFFGTGATRTEQFIVWIGGAVGTGIVIWHAWTQALPWAWWQYAVATLLALDVLGGVVANSLNSCKRFYHSPVKPEEVGFTALAKNHFVFTLLHVHTILIGLLFSLNWQYGIIWYMALVLSSLLVLGMPLYLQRAAAMGIIMLAILVNFYLIQPVSGFEWLVPALFLKIVYGHLVREEPYRP